MATNADNKGVFVISIDFELLWGVWDVTSKEAYGENIVGVKQAIPSLLQLFSDYHVKATFATVGFLFAKNKEELLNALPSQKPFYSNNEYNVYLKEMTAIGDNEDNDPYHFGYSLLEQIKNSNHETGSHTFSHYYCLEDGQSIEEFEADLLSAKKIAASNNVEFTSFVFPRNQVNEKYLSILKDHGVNVYRGNPTSWIYKPRKLGKESFFIRLCRLLDAYIPFTGMNTYPLVQQKTLPVNIPASRFLKPYFKPLGWFEKLRLLRIKNGMTHAAKKNELYHLWWHPHNFGKDLDRNIYNLTVLLQHYQKLNSQYGFMCCTMQEAARLVSNDI